MRKIFAICALLVAVGVYAQSNNPPPVRQDQDYPPSVGFGKESVWEQGAVHSMLNRDPKWLGRKDGRHTYMSAFRPMGNEDDAYIAGGTTVKWDDNSAEAEAWIDSVATWDYMFGGDPDTPDHGDFIARLRSRPSPPIIVAAFPLFAIWDYGSSDPWVVGDTRGPDLGYAEFLRLYPDYIAEVLPQPVGNYATQMTAWGLPTNTALYGWGSPQFVIDWSDPAVPGIMADVIGDYFDGQFGNAYYQPDGFFWDWYEYPGEGWWVLAGQAGYNNPAGTYYIDLDGDGTHSEESEKFSAYDNWTAFYGALRSRFGKDLFITGNAWGANSHLASAAVNGDGVHVMSGLNAVMDENFPFQWGADSDINSDYVQDAFLDDNDANKSRFGFDSFREYLTGNHIPGKTSNDRTDSGGYMLIDNKLRVNWPFVAIMSLYCDGAVAMTGAYWDNTADDDYSSPARYWTDPMGRLRELGGATAQCSESGGVWSRPFDNGIVKLEFHSTAVMYNASSNTQHVPNPAGPFRYLAIKDPTGDTPDTLVVGGAHIGVTLANNGAPPSISVRTRFDLATEVRVDAQLVSLLNSSESIARVVVAQDTVGTVHTKPHSFFIEPSTWLAYEGDTVNVWVRSYNASDTLIDVASKTFVLDSAGVLRDVLMACKNPTGHQKFGYPHSAVAAGLMPDTTSWATKFDTVIEDQDGTYVRYGCVLRSAPTIHAVALDAGRAFAAGANAHNEDDVTLPAGAQMTLMWYDFSDIPDNAKIAKAYLVGAVGAFSTRINVESGGYVSVRMDTTLADLVMLDSATPVALDARILDTSWNELDVVGNKNWSPTLDSRLDWHDFGPRSRIIDYDIDTTGGEPFRIDVTNLVQQYVDNKRGAVPGPFVLNAVNATECTISVGFNASYSMGTPVLIIRWVDGVDSVNPWGDGGLVPVVFGFDDSDSCQALMNTRLEAAGYNSTQNVCLTSLRPPYDDRKLSYAQLQGMVAAGTDFVHHSRSHPSLGTLSTKRQFDNQIGRGWIDSVFTGGAGTTDTTAVQWQDFAWPVGSAPIYSKLALQYFVDYGYRSARSAGGSVNPIGTMGNMGLDNYVNVYAINGGLPVDLKLASQALVTEELEDMADIWYTDYGRSPMIFYIHTISDLSHTQLQYLVGAINALGNVGVLTYEQAVTRRYAGQHFVLPNNSFAAAMYDSLYQLGDERYGRMWLPPFH